MESYWKVQLYVIIRKVIIRHVSPPPKDAAVQDLHPPQSLEIDDDSPQSNGAVMTYSQGRRPLIWPSLLLGMLAGVGLTLVVTQFLVRKPAPPEAVQTTISPPASQTVTIAQVTSGAVAETLAVNGTVKATDLLSIAPQVSGLQIRQVLVREGDGVAAGQVLAELDDTTLQADLRQAEAQLAVAQAQVTQRQAALAQSRASLMEAQQNLKRSEALASRGAISDQELTRQRTQLLTAQEAVGLAGAEVESARSAVRAQQAALERLQTQLTQTAVRAPVAGIVAERRATVGDISSPAVAVVTLIQNNELRLVAEVPQSQLDQVTPGAAVLITSNTDSRLQLRGIVQSIDPVVNVTTRTALVNITLPANDLLKVGMFLRAEITTASRQGLMIPAAAVQPQADGTSQVFLLGPDNQVTARTLELGSRLPARGDQPPLVEVRQGLQAGDQVVTSGVGFLQDGDRVTVSP